MNLGELRDLARAQSFGASRAADLVDVGDAIVDAHVNKALHKIERAAVWKFSETETDLTVPSGQRTPTSPPSDVGTLLFAYNLDSGDHLQFWDDSQRVYDPDDTGSVAWYGTWGGTLTFYPTPTSDTDVRLRYYRVWPDLSADGDTPLFPATFHDVLADYATAMLLLRVPPQGDRFLPESAARPWMDQFRAGVAEMVASPLALRTADSVTNHDHRDMIAAGAGEWW